MSFRNAVPLNWRMASGPVRLNLAAAKFVWETVFDKGHDPEKLRVKCQEIGDGTLAVGFYEHESDDFSQPIKDLGFIIPLGFWHTTDGRMPINWIDPTPSLTYGPPGVGISIADPTFYQSWVDASGNL